ncbi:hypothetical protein V1478_016165 [Vespula squamosa]|uniref:Chitin-binding type-2 domain-containing protein n=1 Tax=Vespula squamosa TaxID=30214 RepID=A0ABD1ZZ15_VESSQ
MNSLSVLSNYEGTCVVRLSVRIEVSCIANREASVLRSSLRSHRFRFDESKTLKKSVGGDNTVTILFDSFLNMARGGLLILNITYCTTMGLPTFGHVERNRLETYEDLSDQSIDLNLFSNLTFQFSCENKPIGLYADVDYDCRIFHACDEDGKGFPMICPNNTVFDQRQRVCSDIVNDCEHAHEWYYINELPYSDELTDYNKVESIEDNIPTVVPLAAA